MRPYKNQRAMKYDPAKHHRQGLRMPHTDYSGVGIYAVTICAARRGDIFGRVVDAQTVHPHPWGRLVIEEWLQSFEIRPELELDTYILMPDHLHAIVAIIEDASGEEALLGAAAGVAYRTPRSISTFVSGFKGAAQRRISAARGQQTKVWQERFWDRVIRDENELQNQRQYIFDNPARWLENRQP